METANIKSIIHITGSDPLNKVSRLLDFTSNPGDIADPWYTGNFDLTYDDINDGCIALLNHLKQRYKL